MKRGNTFKIGLIYIFTFLLLALSVYAAGEVVVTTDKLNYWDATTHEILVSNTGSENVLVNFTYSEIEGFTWNGTVASQCYNYTEANISAGEEYMIQCNLTSGGSGSFIVTSNASLDEYTVTSITGAANSTYTANTLQFVRIKDYEIMHTLVEYGRGRGNYFYDTLASGVAGSGHTGEGCAYLPNDTMFELNFLHKIHNIKQYFGLADEDAVNVTFDCTYPNSTVVRHHLTSSISRTGDNWAVSYYLSQIEGSWERMGYLGMDFDAGEFTTGDFITVNCSNLQYELPGAYGNVTVDEDSFMLEIRDKEPITVTPSTTTATVYNGTSEVYVTYEICNTEQYNIDDVIIEIDAPSLATFVGVAGELWGTSQDQFRWEKSEMLSGECNSITLLARFDTSANAGLDVTDLTEGVTVDYLTCWESQAYSPQSYTQYFTGGSGDGSLNSSYYNVSVSNSSIVSITSIIEILETINITTNDIYELSQSIESTILYINNTVWGNLTAQDLLTEIESISVDFTEVLNKLENIQQFDEELVFLVTDSFNLQQQARSDVQEGNLDSARSNLQQANSKLLQAADRLSTLEETAEVGSAGSFGWVLPLLFAVAAIGGAGYYLFSKPKS